jgi:hypothetical protein
VGAITCTTITTNNNNINAGTGTVTTGTVTAGTITTTSGDLTLNPGGSINCSFKSLTNVNQLQTNSITTSSSTDITFNGKNLTSVGNITSTGSISALSFNATSDRRVKANIVSLQSASNEYNVDNLKPVTYFNTLSHKNDVGFIAQDVEEVYPFMVDSSGEYKSLNYISIIGILVKEIQDLKKEIREMKNK